MMYSSPVSGQITGISLTSFLQMMETEEKTCTLKVFTRNNFGRIFFLNGVIVDGATTRSENVQALYEILSWDDVVIEVGKNDSRTENVINLSLMDILMDSAQHYDEIKQLPPPPDNGHPSGPLPEKELVRTTANEDLHMEIGARLFISFDGMAAPLQSTLVGMEPGRYLLLKTPAMFAKVDHDLFKVKDLIIKSIVKGTIYAFRSKLVDIISKPMKLMFIEYPRKIEQHELRSDKRYKCSIGIQMQVNGKKITGTLENIGKGGCRCSIPIFSIQENIPDSLVNAVVPFKCAFPGFKDEIHFLGKVKSAKIKEERIIAGVQFIDQPDQEKPQALIQDYLQMIECFGQNV